MQLKGRHVVPKLSLRLAGVLVRPLEVVDAPSLAGNQHACDLNVPVYFREMAMVRMLLHAGRTPQNMSGSLG